MEATALLLEDHTRVRPVRTLPFASSAVPVICKDCRSTTVEGDGETVIRSIGTVETVTGATPWTPPIVALTVVFPLPTAVTVLLPVVVEVLMVATLGELEAHVTGRPVSTFPAASLAVAVTADDCPGDMANADGESVTEATGTLVTVTTVLAETPSTVARMVAVPPPTPVTTPAELTVATPGAREDHAIVRPSGESGAPAASKRRAVSETVEPTRIVGEDGTIETLATAAGVTVIAATAVTPSTEAEMPAVPTDTPVTSPVDETLATPGAEEFQTTTRPVIRAPVESMAVAVSCSARPCTTLATEGAMLTRATLTLLTVMVTLAEIPSDAAKMSADPGPTALTSPDWFTVATLGAPEIQVTTRPGNTLLLASRAVAESCNVPPTLRAPDSGVMLRLATGTGVTFTAALPVFPSTRAVIVARPELMPVTSPVVSTVAMLGWSVFQATRRPERSAPAESIVRAVSCTVRPAGKVDEEGVTITESTGTGVTVILAVAARPSLEAVMVAVPRDRPVTTPLEEIEATVTSLEDQAICRPASGLPPASVGVAVSCSD